MLCNGKATLPAGWCNSVWTWILILVPSTIQIIYVNSAYSTGLNVLIQIVYIVTMVSALASLLFTTCSDPGIVPRPLAYRSDGQKQHQQSAANAHLSSKKVRPASN